MTLSFYCWPQKLLVLNWAVMTMSLGASFIHLKAISQICTYGILWQMMVMHCGWLFF